MWFEGLMEPFVYRCPRTGMNVQGFVAEDAVARGNFVTIKCLVCQQTHLVNPKDGRIVGAEAPGK